MKGYPPGELVPLTPTRKAIAQKMALSLQSAPQFTICREVGVGPLAALRQRLKAEAAISYTDLLVKAVALTLRQHRTLNATWTDQGVYLFQDINIGVSVATPEGVITPVLRGADSRSLADISREVKALSEKARTHSLKLQEIIGGTFTITNMGMYQIDTFTPVLNPPQAAILGVGRITERLYLTDGKVTSAPVMDLSLTIDHRVLDGAQAAEFLQAVDRLLESPNKLTE